MAELRFGRENIFYRVLKHKVDSIEFLNFMESFRELQWWPNSGSNNEGTQLNILFSKLGLTRMITEPTHFHDH